MLIRKTFFAVIFPLLLLSVVSNAWAGQYASLNGIERITTLTESVDNDARSCGLTKDGMTEAMTFPINASAIEIFKGFGGWRLYLNTMTIFVPSLNICSTVINMQLSKSASKGKLVVWATRSIDLDYRSDHKRKIHSSIESMSKQLVTVWNKDNK